MPFATSNFLVPNGTLIVEIIAFAIVLGFIWHYVLPPLNRMLEERQEQIRSSLEAAQAARTEADQTRAQRQEILDEARAQAREIVAQANRTAERLKSEGEERGRQEYERLVSSANTEIGLARRRAVDEVSSQMAHLVVAAARQVVGREIDERSHRDLIDEAIAALHGAGTEPSATGSRE